MTRQELWNGNREPFSNLWSLNPEKSIIAWAASRHRCTDGATRRPRPTRDGTGCASSALRSQAEADAFLAGVASAETKEE